MSKEKTSEIWNTHYSREKSKLTFPDENLVRVLSKLPIQSGKALDFGAGSGRHSYLLKSRGWEVTALDYAEKSLDQIKEIDKEIHLVHSTNPPYPFSDNEFDLIVNWGVLHYNSHENILKIISEFKRILKPNGIVTGTLRSDSDTHLSVKNGKIQIEDLKSADVSLFSLEDLKEYFKDFKNLQIGYMERTPIGNLEQRICHWIYMAEK
ncbi:MAG: class I SAM-dependent methyltransferase [Leptospiraceae bacterium]|nr:class I SAM-dependent methyltransferase [Leptospiraceae bacterium]